MKTEYYSGQGKLFIAKYGENGELEPSRWLGNVPKLEIKTKVERKDHEESHTGQRTKDKSIATKTTVDVNFSVEEISDENLALAFYGDVEVINEASVSDEPIKTIKKGENYRLKQQNVSNVVINDNNDQPLVENKDYVVHAKHGRITYISDSDSLQMPLKVSYSHGKNSKIDFFANVQGEYQLIFEGLNTAENNAPLTVIVHKVALDPDSSFALINDGFSQFDLSAQALNTDNGLVSIVK